MPEIFSIVQCMAARNDHGCHSHVTGTLNHWFPGTCSPLVYLLVGGGGGVACLGYARHRSYLTTLPSSLACFVRETIAAPPMMLHQKYLIATSLVVVVPLRCKRNGSNLYFR